MTASAVAAPAFRQSDPGEPVILPHIGAELFGLDRAHSQLDFVVRFLGMTDVRGTFGTFDASILYDEDDLTNTSVTLVVDVESIDTQNDWRDRDLRSERFFHAEEHPRITFQSDRIEPTDDAFVAHGRLTMRGVTRDVAVPFRRMLKRTVDSKWGNVRIGFQGALTLRRNDYNIHGGDFWGIDAVSDEVRIEFALLGTRSNLERWSYDSRENMSIGEELERVVAEKGAEAAVAHYRILAEERPDDFNFAEGQLNMLGYRMLRRGHVDDAHAIFALTTEIYPESANAHDSLAEAYATRGDVEAALTHYREALRLEPHAANAMEMVRALERVRR